jgi:hypoxanthine phosphoribosyltransferase
VRSVPDNDRIAGRHVLIVDDILDTGRTIGVVQGRLREAGCASLASAVLIERTRDHIAGVVAEYVGFRLDDGFVIGYGLDFNGHYRGLPYVALLDTERMLPR